MARSIRYELITARGQVTTARADFPDEPDSREWFLTVKALFRSYFGAEAFLERVNVWHEDRYKDMFVDEDGRLKRLPINTKATAIYRANVLTHDPNPPPAATMPSIYGDALLFHEKVWS